MKRALIFGAGGFIGSHLAKRLKSEGYWIRGVDLKYPEFSTTAADEFMLYDLRDPSGYETLFAGESFDEVYQLAADMGGATYILTGDHDADVMSNSVLINTNTAKACVKYKATTLFFSSSACVYNEHNQLDPLHPVCTEASAYPANPDSEYGWEKIFSERLYLAFAKAHGLRVRIARFHNIFGYESTWDGGKEKAPAALSRKVALVQEGGNIEIIGDGNQTRTFLFIEDCLDAVRLLVKSDVTTPINIGSEELISINDFITMLSRISGKTFSVTHITGPVGVRGRKSDNTLIRKALGWEPKVSLRNGMEVLYNWILEQIKKSNGW